MITPERLQEVLNYDPATGLFRWKELDGRKSKGRARPGGIAGGMLLGYVVIRVDGQKYMASALATLWMEGFMPDYVRYRDGNPSNIAWWNLEPRVYAKRRLISYAGKDLRVRHCSKGEPDQAWCAQDVYALPSIIRRPWDFAFFRHHGISQRVASVTQKWACGAFS